jgi:hypothetical protein
MEHQLAARGVRADALGQRAEVNATLTEFGDQLDQMRKTAPESVESPDNYGVTFLEVIKQASQLGSVRLRTRYLVGIHHLTTRSDQSIVL